MKYLSVKYSIREACRISDESLRKVLITKAKFVHTVMSLIVDLVEQLTAYRVLITLATITSLIRY